ncbi:phosphoglycerate dehydrogenase (plasmid) [Rhodococcus globerulus]|uniref:phosphoglycerate dehydrogenase n=1 Tax=Rhodococcus globerulus TaxID=33008 RepID=UPI0039EAF67C
MAHILITTDYLVAGDDVDRMFTDRGHTTTHSPAGGTRPDGELASLLAESDAALVAGEKITGEMISGAPRLAIIARSGVGFDSVDVDAVGANGVVVTNTPGANSNAVAEMALMLMLMCARRAGETTAYIAEGDWPRHDTYELRESTLGIVGFGPSARRLAELATALGMSVVVTTTYPDPELDVRYAELDDLLTVSDFVSLHARATKENTGIVGRRELALMKPTASLINTARGSLVDEDALATALRDGTLAGAGLDVFAVEPLPKDSPLRALPNVVMMSHLGGQTVQARAAASRAAAEDILRVLAGEKPVSPVTP